MAQRSSRIHRSAQGLQSLNITVPAHQVGHNPQFTGLLEPVNPKLAYVITQNQNEPLYLGPWLSGCHNDPATKVQLI